MAFDSQKYSGIFNSFYIELSFEFSSYYSVQKTVGLISNKLNKKIETTNSKEFSPDGHTFQLRCNEIFKNPYCQLKTGRLGYQEARFVMIKMFESIKEFGFTNPDNFLRVKLSTTGDQGVIPRLTNIDRLKIILDFDEGFPFVKFDNLKDSAYVRSMYNIVPINKRKTESPGINETEYSIPNGEIYGIDFTQFSNGSVGFNYIGGDNYETKIMEALDVLDYYMLMVAKTLNSAVYTDENKRKLIAILDDIENVLIGYESPKHFKEQFENIKLTIDLKDNEQILKAYWDKIKDKLFDLLANSNIKKGSINYDSYLARMQIKDMSFMSHNLEDFEIVDCVINDSKINNCNIYRSEIKDSRIERSNLYGNTGLLKCKAKDNFFNSTTTAEDCYIFGPSTVFNGIMRGGIFREGNKGVRAEFKSSVKVVKYTEIKPTKMKIG